MASRPVATRASSRSRTNTPAPTPPTTRTTRTRAASKAPEEQAPAPARKPPSSRKPLSKRDNLEPPPPSKPKAKAPSSKALKQAQANENEREAIMAYLRIRPRIGEEPSKAPYLVPISDTSVRMTDPNDTQNRSQYRASVIQPSSIYTFSHVFPPETQQVDFFTKTTLPLVKDLLQGQNGLLFTYGVTNSGKTYTVQGGSEPGTAGILPRTLDVIFNSIDGLHGDGRYRPVRLYGVEPADASDSAPPQISSAPAVAQVLQSLDDPSEPNFETDPTVVEVDRNYEYTVWLSYAEVYNEKVYDLLASAKDDETRVDSPAPRAGQHKIPTLTRQALTLRPSPPADNPDTDITGKYISGLRQFRVTSAAQAKSLVKIGQLHRRVFGTLANQASSRSHGMVIIKIMRGHRGEKDDPTSLQISRLTLVDLAGSERTKHTHTTGDRLKEAGNINKSLMVLGQCLEVLRSNQRKLAMSLAHEGVGENGRMDTRDVKRTLAVIPFRHSKMTEALMDYFIGDGRVVMIVNINPYDTGYDENSHIMKFAALAREVHTNPGPAPVSKLPPNFGPGKAKGNKIKEPGPLSLRGSDIAPKPFYRRKVTISMGGTEAGKRVNEAIVEVVEAEEEDQLDDNDGEEGEEPPNPLVDALFEEIERLRIQLYDAEMRCALIEADTREEVMHEMEERMRTMEQMYSRRLMSEIEQNNLKTDAKIDMLHQAGLFSSPVKRSDTIETLSEAEEEDVEMSLIQEESDEDAVMSDATKSVSASPLARKDKTARSSNPFKNMGTHPIGSDDEELTEIEDSEQSEEDDDEDDEEGTEEEEEEGIEEDDDDDDYKESQNQSEEEDDWEPSLSTKKRTPAKPRPSTSKAAPPSTTRKPSRVSKLATEIDTLKLSESTSKKDGPPPKKKPRSSLDTDSEDEESDVPVAPKKKRQVPVDLWSSPTN
ncbi:kinesin-like protein KIF23 [Coprinopsis cinerea okayama7|uniref:Kinesin-like protein n=1 Tax=Coprinopsis cinerea (strain Okayama-7 / 130 / ATCC MYA-4618 / FGSC 9003) TaxID=240176 RepID=A8N176_COPC7|nr:kinesin-like protein KIF23 [Coprinopsis cinerea okayama7\|eukprot:XP_001828624.2 kinesin-like protein KIF23 [Coprinopsis cinerea okayama7\